MAKMVREFGFTEEERKERGLDLIDLEKRGRFEGKTLRIYDDKTARLYGVWELPEYLIVDEPNPADHYEAEIVIKTEVDFRHITSPDQILNSGYEYGMLIVLEDEGEENNE